MGRELRRVPLDFDWPLNAVWKGFLHQEPSPAVECPRCGGSGASQCADRLKDLWYGYKEFKPEDRGSTPFLPADAAVRRFAERNVANSPDYYGRGEAAVMREAERLCRHWNSSWSHHLNADDVAALVAADRLWDFTRDFVPGKGWQDKETPYIPAPREVNEWSISGFGHDAINQWVCVKAECARLGEPYLCDRCNGEGELWPSPETKAAYNAWRPTDPPTGDGYQIWETVSEGSPISPVFSTPEELARHMAGTRWGADEGTPYEAWLAFIKGPGWAPSLVMTSTGLVSGIDAVSGGAASI